MNTGRTKAPLINFIEVNPRETIDKGHLSKKIGMDKLQPFVVIFKNMKSLNLMGERSFEIVILLWHE